MLKPAAIEPREGGSGLRIVMIASEATPFSKTGGLADVATALSKALGRMGHHVTLVTPRYRGAGEGEPSGTVRAYIADNWFEGTLLDVPLGPGARVLLVDCPPLYDRAGLYTERNIDYPDNPLRFGFLSVAALEWAGEQATPPSVFHIHDWQTGLTPVYARRFVTTKTRVPFVQTLHNLALSGRRRQALGTAAWPQLGRLHRAGL